MCIRDREAAGETSEIVVRLETERNTYKALYEQLFERMLNGGTGK
jgi:mRNA interferase MazF